MGWLFDCYTGTLLKLMLPLPCSIASSDNYLIIKACSSSIMGRATPSTVKKKSISSHWAFLLRPTFISCQRKVSK